MRLLFCADIHGNTFQYNKIFNYAKNFDYLVFGGDICQKGLTKSMNEQRDFLETFFIPNLKELKKINRKIKIFLIPGNEDYAGIMDIFNKYDDNLFNIIINKVIKLDNNFSIAGYPYVPISPFKLKDFEKWDLENIKLRNIFDTKKEILLTGVTTVNMRYESKIFNYTDEDSIENDMKELFNLSKPQKTIYVFHSPPYNTNLDLAYSNEHIGSFAIRMAIENYQPYLTLHGHIHETVEKSGNFIDRIKDTISTAPGNHNNSLNPHVLDINIISRSINRINLK
ncbi:MAG: metallophosphoesterase family protein [Nanoarchaeota archaeon]